MSSRNESTVEIREEPNESAYVILSDGERVGKTEYVMREGRHVFIHTEVDQEHSGSGLAARLIRYALDDVRSRGGLVVPLCPFVYAYIRRHPEYQDLVDQEMTKRYRARRK